MFELTVEVRFSAAHQIRGHAGPCARLHGHNYRAVIGVVGEQLDDLGMLIDFGQLKQICAGVVSPLDHSYLNELPDLASGNPTAEAIAEHIYRTLAGKLAADAGGALRVSHVTVFESESASATYRG